jgi:hypothetical protein
VFLFTVVSDPSDACIDVSESLLPPREAEIAEPADPEGDALVHRLLEKLMK